MTALLDRRATELGLRMNALRGELAAWREASQAGAVLEKHHTQVRRIAAVIEGLLKRVEEEPAPTTLSAIRAIEEKLLTAHGIWEFFRAKLAQRLDTSFRDHLRVCDDLAFNCYDPVCKRFLARAAEAGEKSGTKEPPLVYLNAGWSPFAMARNAAFQVDHVAGGWLAHGDFRSVVEALPVPMIGLPWYQFAHLPDVLVTAHEVGHIVEWDFGMRCELAQAVARVRMPAERTEAWIAWQSEVFADLYGCLACGAAFAASLIDFFAADVAKVAADRRAAGQWGVYPPAWLRARLLVETLRALGSDAEAHDLDRRWTELYGVSTNNVEFTADAEKIAAALLSCTCTSIGVTVRDLLQPFAVDARAVASNLLQRNAPGTEDTRVLLAASRWLWEIDSEAYVAKEQDKRIRGLIKIPPGTRGLAPADLPAREQSDRDVGGRLFDFLFPLAND